MILENSKNRIIIKAKSRPIISVTEENHDPKAMLLEVCEAIREGGYNPVSQIVGYIISEDPTHIANYKNARTLMSKLDRDELLEHMVEYYIEAITKERGEESEKK